jgi:hypothetical protein
LRSRPFLPGKRPCPQYAVAFQRLAEPDEMYGRLGFERGTQNPQSLVEQRGECKVREVVIWKRDGIDDREEPNYMAGVSPQLAGNARETDLAPRYELALSCAISALEPADDHPALAAAVEKLRGVAGEPDETEIEKALLDVQAARVTLAKSASASSSAGLDASVRLRKAEHDLSVEILRKSPGAWSERSARERLEHIQKAEGGRA